MISSKHFALILFFISLCIIFATYGFKVQEDFYIDEMIKQMDGVCILENDYCLHNDRNWLGYIVSWSAGGVLLILSVYLFFYDKSYQQFKQEQYQFVKKLDELNSKESFSAYLAGFTDEEQKVLKAVNDQDGISQSTLRFRTGMSKASLSLLLNELEKRSIISREISGKSKKVYLQKKY